MRDVLQRETTMVRNLVLGAIAALLVTFGMTPAAQAASLQRFWVFNFTDMNIYYVYVNGSRKDLMGANGILYYDPHKVPDQVLVLKPRNGSCNAEIKILAGYEDEEPYVTYKYANLCRTGQTINVYPSDF
jgi:hypothetical protein